MEKQELDKMIMLLHNISKDQIAQTYGAVDFDSCEECRQGYLIGKLNRAIKNPISWLSELDNNNRNNFTKLVENYQG